MMSLNVPVLRLTAGCSGAIGAIAGMGQKGYCYGNAAMEAF